LKGLLEAEWKTKENIVLKKLSGRDAQQSFLRQFERYARGQYPFDTPLEDGESTLSWWKHLTRIPEGNIIAVSLYFTRTNNFTYAHEDPRCQNILRSTKLYARRAHDVCIHTHELCTAKSPKCTYPGRHDTDPAVVHV
jgi:hypothetical protein